MFMNMVNECIALYLPTKKTPIGIIKGLTSNMSKLMVPYRLLNIDN